MKSIAPVHKVKGYGTGNVYIIEAEELVLVDTGIPRDSRLVCDSVRRLGRSPDDVAHILLTHFHVDHAGGAAALRDATGATVYAQRDDAAFIQGDERIQSIYKLGVIGRAASLAPVTAERLTDVPHVKVDRPLADGEVIPVLGGIQVIHSPGHTPGSACFFWPDRGILFTGDTIINTYHFLTLPTIGFSCDFDRAADSADHVAGLFANEKVSLLCPGHGPFVSDNAGERLRRFRRRLARR